MERETKQLENELDHEKQITCSPASCGTGWRPGCNHDPLMAYMKKKAEESKNAFVRLRSRES